MNMLSVAPKIAIEIIVMEMRIMRNAVCGLPKMFEARKLEIKAAIAFPTVDQSEIDEENEENMAMIMGIIDAVRNIRGEMGFPPSTKVDVQIRAGDHRSLIETYEHYIKELAKVSAVGYVGCGGAEKGRHRHI